MGATITLWRLQKVSDDFDEKGNERLKRQRSAKDFPCPVWYQVDLELLVYKLSVYQL